MLQRYRDHEKGTEKKDMIIYTIALWFYSTMASLVFGAGVYEGLVVHPAWSRKPPESFVGFVGLPISRMNLPAFWKPVTSIYLLSSLVVLGVAFGTGKLGNSLAVSCACTIASAVWTLTYFRPTIVRFLEKGGGGASPQQLQSEAKRWIFLNWIRILLGVVAWVGALIELATQA